MKINILCDNESSWFWNTNENFINQLKKLGHTVGVYKNEFIMPNADISAFISCTKLVSSDGLKKVIQILSVIHLTYLRGRVLHLLLGMY